MKYRIDASKQNPSEDHRNNLADSETAFTRGRVEQIVCDFIKQGYWVEVFDDESGELLAGPFDPEARARVAVAF